MERSLEVAEDSGILDRIIPADLAEKTRQASVVKNSRKFKANIMTLDHFRMSTRHFDKKVTLFQP